jgi:hypothetical protein
MGRDYRTPISPKLISSLDRPASCRTRGKNAADYHPTLALGPVMLVPGAMLLSPALSPGTALPDGWSVTVPESDEAQAATKDAKAASKMIWTRRSFISQES